jgi:hypothetical protein
MRGHCLQQLLAFVCLLAVGEGVPKKLPKSKAKAQHQKELL